jgi:hypothetical protein
VGEVSESPPRYQTISELIKHRKDESIDSLYQKEFKNFIYSLLKRRVPHESININEGKKIVLGFSRKRDDFLELIDLKKVSKKYDTFEQAYEKKSIDQVTYFMIRNDLSPSDMRLLRDRWNTDFGEQVKLYYNYGEKYHKIWCEIYDKDFPIIV